MKKAYIIQPGKLGDLIVNAPIATYYNNIGFQIEWFVFDIFETSLKRLPNINVITFNLGLDKEKYFNNKRFDFGDTESRRISELYFQNVKKYIAENKTSDDIILDICWGFPGANPQNNNLIGKFHFENRNWIDMRYSLAKTPLSERWGFSWIRDEPKEDKLLAFIKEYAKKKYGSEQFSIVHNYRNNPRQKNLKNEINFAFIPGYEIYDWYKVLLHSEEIACVDSSLCNFVEVLPALKEKKKYYLGSEEPHYFEYMRNILLNNWHDVNSWPIISDYIGKI